MSFDIRETRLRNDYKRVRDLVNRSSFIEIVSTEGDPVAGDGTDASLLGTTEGPGGATQVVYNGWPLWYFAGDQGPGDVNGHGLVSFGGTWLLVSPSGDGIEVAGENGAASRLVE